MLRMSFVTVHVLLSNYL